MNSRGTDRLTCDDADEGLHDYENDDDDDGDEDDDEDDDDGDEDDEAH